MAEITREQFNQIVQQAPKGTDPKEIMNGLLQRGHTLQGYVPEQKQDGFLNGMAKAIATPFARFGVTAYKAGTAIGGLGNYAIDKLKGDNASAQQDLNTASQMTAPTPVDLPWLGKVNPYGAEKGQMKDVGGQVRDIAGAGLQLASFASGSPALMGGMYNLGQSIENKDSLGQTALSTVEGAALGKVTELGFKGTGKLLGKAGKALETTGLGSQAMKDAATANYTRVLSPTTKANKIIAQKIAPEMAKRKIVGLTRGSLQSKSESEMQTVGQKIRDAWDVLPDDTKINILPSLKRLADARKSLFVTAENKSFVPDANQDLYKKLGGIAIELSSMAKDGMATAKSLRQFRQVLDNAINKSGKGFGLSTSDSVVLESQKTAANIFRDELSKPFPDIASMNKEFNFWSGMNKVLSATIERKTGQAKTGLGGKIMQGAGFLAGIGHGIISGVEAATTMRWLSAIATSPAWETLSGASKSKLADFLAKGETTKAGALLLLMAEKAGVGLEKAGGIIGGVPSVIKNTPAGEIPGSDSISKASGYLYKQASEPTLKGSIKNPLAKESPLIQEARKGEGTKVIRDLGFSDPESIKPIKLNGKVVGGIDATPDRGNNEIWRVHNIRISPEAQGKGLGKQAVTQLFQENPNVNKIIGNATDEARPFWKKIGAEFPEDKTQTYFSISRNKYLKSQPLQEAGKKVTALERIKAIKPEELGTMSDFTDFVDGTYKLSVQEAKQLLGEVTSIAKRHGIKIPKTKESLANAFDRILEKLKYNTK